MDCSTIIVSYNTFALTQEAVRSALAAAEGLAQEVVVVDNASPDDSAARLRQAFPADQFPQVHLLANAKNTGFSAANNQGARQATGAVLFFLNPDTLVHGQAIRILYDFLRHHPEAGAVGPHVLNADGSDQASTFRFISAREIIRQHLPLTSLLRGADYRLDPIPAQTTPVDVVKGCALALRREVFDAVGGWDESYFMYSEEVELCHALAHRGYRNYFVREAQITHYGGASSMERYAEQQIVQQRSHLQFLRRHGRYDLLWLNRLMGLLGFGARVLLFHLLTQLRPERALDYQRRGAAARTLLRWYISPYS